MREEYKRDFTKYEVVKKYINYMYYVNVNVKDKMKCKNISFIGKMIICEMEKQKLEIPKDEQSAIQFLSKTIDDKLLTRVMKKSIKNGIKKKDVDITKELVKWGHIQDVVNEIFNTKLNEYKTGLYQKREVKCECGEKTNFVDSSCIYYGRSYGYIYRCPNCGRYVGVHKGTNIPLGTPADKETQQLRRKVHSRFDKRWTTQKERSEEYLWLANKLDKDVNDTHIGMLNRETCLKVLELLK